MSQDRPTLSQVTIPVAVLGIDTKLSICPYQALDAILDAQKQDAENWLDLFRHWIAQQLKTPPESLRQDQVVAFNDIVVQVVEALREDRKKKVGEIVDWLLSTQVSPTTFGSGPTS